MTRPPFALATALAAVIGGHAAAAEQILPAEDLLPGRVYYLRHQSHNNRMYVGDPKEKPPYSRVVSDGRSAGLHAPERASGSRGQFRIDLSDEPEYFYILHWDYPYRNYLVDGGRGDAAV